MSCIVVKRNSRSIRYWQCILFVAFYFGLAGCANLNVNSPSSEKSLHPLATTATSTAVTVMSTATAVPTAASSPTASPVVLPTPTPTVTRLPVETVVSLPDAREYWIQPGDTLAVVAARFQVSTTAVVCLDAHQTIRPCFNFPQEKTDANIAAEDDPAHLIFSSGQRVYIIKPPDTAVEGSRVYPLRQVLPDSAVVFSKSGVGFDAAAYLGEVGGYLHTHRQYLMISGWTTGAEIVAQVAIENSVDPRLLLALLEYQCRCVLGVPGTLDEIEPFLGADWYKRADLYGQLAWAVHELSHGYYGWRAGEMTAVTTRDGQYVQLSPDLNAGTAALAYLFAQLYDLDDWINVLDPETGFAALYGEMFGNPWQAAVNIYPGIPTQPLLHLPFEAGKVWGYSGGPHPAWEGSGPLAALDFAPPSTVSGCFTSPDWVVAMADGPVVRIEQGLVVQDLDGDGMEQTGWVLLYMHIAEPDRVALGQLLKAGDYVGHPSCEGGRATGTHLHIARKYNGEWIAADGPLPFDLDGWIAHAGEAPYKGTLVRNDEIITACTCSAAYTWISRDE